MFSKWISHPSTSSSLTSPENVRGRKRIVLSRALSFAHFEEGPGDGTRTVEHGLSDRRTMVRCDTPYDDALHSASGDTDKALSNSNRLQQLTSQLWFYPAKRYLILTQIS